MNRYSLEELRQPSTYQADAALATLARRVGEAAPLDLPLGERKRLALSGEMAEAVLVAVEERCRVEEKAAQTAAENLAAVQALPLPPGWTATITGSMAALKGPYHEDVQRSLRRHATWDPVGRKWDLPVSAGLTMLRSFKRMAKATPSASTSDRTNAARRHEIERWLGFVEQAAAEGRVYERGVDECRAHAIRDFVDLDQRFELALTKAHQKVDAAHREREAQRLQRTMSRIERARSSSDTTSKRALYPLSQAPGLGVACRLGGEVVVFTGRGKAFPIDADHPSVWGSHLLGHEGDLGAYHYYRLATDDESAALAIREESSGIA